MVNLTLSTRSAADASGDALVVALVAAASRATAAKRDDAASTDVATATLAPGHGLPRKTVSHLTSAIADLELKGSVGELTRLNAVPGVSSRLVLLAGIGEAPVENGDLEDLRKGLGAAVRSLPRKKVTVVVPGSSTALAAATAEGVALGAYAPAKAGATSTDVVESVAIVGPGDAASRKAVKRAVALGEAVAYCRDLVNLPPNLLYPETFVDSLAERVKGTKVKLKSYDMKALRAGGFGGTVGVGQGSVNDPRIAVLTYSPSRPKAKIAFVGKGITFDSGGLCIKPANGMLTMKCDMAGAAAVAAAVLAVAELGLPVAVTGYLGLAENMPSASAQRPSDVVTMRGGTTVEVLNTDAEGRMVLGDCIALASEESPDAIVDVATLTGAQVIALANTAAVMANDDAFRERVVAASATVGEATWPMPLPKELRPSLESINADLAHKGGSEGGMLTAGIFLSEFVGEGIPWSHIDIAGPAFNDKGATGYWPKGGTGFGVRTLVGLAESYA
ncbi:leucyl aminopeptidase [Terracoccus luteus]|uniref:Probable cytosol aminopeptidase n=1 Tax=Terracoccus luteus TaxID=53356 RepID=A0A839PL42_9MICO|nr:leucyl aminopeptidase [Terracoccus luteus]MBB2984980.1 leucyl aminopeptidase [Terracoccus luteus]MCP2170632.1 leucyl aminopeptidase [Terracoccus luteus]